MPSPVDRQAAWATLVAQAQALALAQPRLVADLLREALVVRDGVADAALWLSHLDAGAAAAVLGQMDRQEVLPLAQALLRQRSVPQAQAEQVLSRLLTEASQRVLPLQNPAAFLVQVLPQALGAEQAQPLLQLLGLGPAAPVAVTRPTAAQRARLSQAEVDALLNPAPDTDPGADR